MTPPAADGWVAPGSDGLGRGAEPRPADAPATVPATDEPVGLPRPPAPLRPLTVADLLDGAFAVLRGRPRAVLTIAAVFTLPTTLIAAVAFPDLYAGEDFAGLGANSAAGISGSASLVSFATGSIALVLCAGALAALVDAWYRGEALPATGAITTALRRSPALIVGTVVVHFLELVGMLAVGIGAYIAMGLLHVVAPATVSENLGPLAAVARSWRLCSSRFWMSMLIPALVVIVGGSVGFGIQTAGEFAALAVPDGAEWVFRVAAQLAVGLVVLPFTASVAVLYHRDLRMRVEGADLLWRADVVLG